MALIATASKTHWNYVLALEHDLEVVARYVEFSEANYKVYSIELAHLLFAAASEVDVIAKLLCERLAPTEPRGNIDEYRAALTTAMPDLATMQVLIARYGLTLTPWDNWGVNATLLGGAVTTKLSISETCSSMKRR